MKIIFDGRMLGWTGIGRYTVELLNNLQKIDKKNKYIILLLKKDWNKWYPKASNYTKQLANYRPYGFMEQFIMPWYLYSLRGDLVFSPSPNSPILYFGKRLTVVADLTLIDYKNIHNHKLIYDIKYLFFKLVFWFSVRFSTYIVTYTNFVKAQLVKRYHIIPSKISVIVLATTFKKIKPISINYIKYPFLLYVGNSYPYKNLSLLLNSFKKVQEYFPDLKLVLVGKNDWFYHNLRLQAVRLGIARKIIFTNFISDNKLAYLYQNAKLFIFPSLSEGFGLPGLEAMARGVPVLASNTSCLPEVLGSAAAYFNPLDKQDLKNKILKLLNSPTKLAELKNKGYEQVKKYSWTKTARETLRVYQRYDKSN